MSKKDTEIMVRDASDGVELLVGNKIIGIIRETDGDFDAFSTNEKKLGSFRSYSEAEEEIVRTYNLSL